MTTRTKKEAETKEYVVLKRCYFRKRAYRESLPGESVTLPADWEVPEHFHDLSKGPPPNTGIRKPSITQEMLRKKSFLDEPTESPKAKAQRREAKRTNEQETGGVADGVKTSPGPAAEDRGRPWATQKKWLTRSRS